MLKFPEDIRIHLAVAPVDMGKSFDDLCAVIVDALDSNPLSRDLFLFRSKWVDRIKQNTLKLPHEVNAPATDAATVE